MTGLTGTVSMVGMVMKNSYMIGFCTVSFLIGIPTACNFAPVNPANPVRQEMARSIPYIILHNLYTVAIIPLMGGNSCG